MRPAQEIMGALAASGLSAEQLALVMELSAAVATEARPTVDRAAENKRAYDREYRKAHGRKSRTKSYEHNEPKGSNDRDILTSKVQVSEPSGSSPSPRAWALPVGVSLQVWQDFLKNRKRKNLPNTDTAWKTFNDDLKRISSQTGIPPPELIQRCAGKGWASINDPRDENDRRTNGLGRNQSSSDGLSSTARAALQVFGPG